MKILIAALLCLPAIGAFAQNGFYFQPMAGVGITSSIVKGDYPTDGTARNIVGCQGQAGFAYQRGNLVFGTGLAIMRTGRKFAFDYQYLPYHSATSLRTATGEKNEIYEHFVLPLTVGYRLRLGKRTALVPVAGAELSYNSKVVSTSRENNPYGYPGNAVDIYTGAKFEKYFHRVSLWGTGQVNLELVINEECSFMVGPAIHYMFTNILKTPLAITPVYAPVVYTQEINNYALLLNVGIKYPLGRKHDAGEGKEAALKTTSL